MKNTFTWERFDTTFLRSIVYSNKTNEKLRPKYDLKDKERLIAYMDRICKFPDNHFIKHYRNEIADNFFAGSNHLVSLMKALEKHNYKNVKLGSMDEMLENFKKLRLTSTVLTLIIAEFYRHGKPISADDEFSIFTLPKEIDLTKSVANELSLYDYQQTAVDKLNGFFKNEDKQAGILVMPTGSGKTRVATRFLLQDMVADGWQIIWLTHRAMLIDQAADAIYNSAPIIKLENSKKEKFKMVCVSGAHASVRMTESDDDVMIFSVQTLVRNLPYLQAILKDKVLIIVDEAHHAVAPSYRTVINNIYKNAKKVKLLGLTATPFRINEKETNRLLKMFSNNQIYNITMDTLISKKKLASPKYIKVDTNIEFNTTISLDEREYIRKWGELSPEMKEQMATMTERNALIVSTYLEKKEQFGKTLIFALNATHCISLCEELQKAGVKCDYIYCAHPGNEQKIEKFKNNELDVLVNINVMTEGSDVPDIQTVFLTRPTSSDALLLQMIGRGMRGPESGGTETVNIVDFHDNWGTFASFLDLKMIISEMIDEDPEESETIQHKSKSEMIPWAKIRDLLDAISTSFNEGIFSESVLPSGWYDVIDEDGNDSKVLVFESQLSGYKEMWSDIDFLRNNTDFSGEKALEKYFGDFGFSPSADSLQKILDTFRLCPEEIPHLYPLKNRKKIDAAVIAEQFKAENVGIADIDSRIEAIYSENQQMIDSLYGGLDEYTERINDFIRYPKGIKPLGTKIEEMPYEEIPYAIDTPHDLDKLVREVIDEMFDGCYGDPPPVFWTNRFIEGYFGQYNYPLDGSKGKDYIKINLVLNSSSVKEEVVKYIIYHELLHRDNRTHNAAFREKEHLYPDWIAHERFLTSTFPKFNIKYAM